MRARTIIMFLTLRLSTFRMRVLFVCRTFVRWKNITQVAFCGKYDLENQKGARDKSSAQAVIRWAGPVRMDRKHRVDLSVSKWVRT
jgi:hypothetical protein